MQTTAGQLYAFVAVLFYRPTSGEEPLGRDRRRPVPMLALHGDADVTVPFAATPRTMQTWAAHNGCQPTPLEARPAPKVVLRSFTGCAADVAYYVVEGGTHEVGTWDPFPGGGRILVAWNFFAAHPLR